jgi:hypothetical protein
MTQIYIFKFVSVSVGGYSDAAQSEVSDYTHLYIYSYGFVSVGLL